MKLEAHALFGIVASVSAHARYYDPVTGRFINRDPVDNVENQQGVGAATVHVQTAGRFVSRSSTPTHFAGVNLYQYVDSKPTKYMDPMGTTVYSHCVEACLAKKDNPAGTLAKEVCANICKAFLDNPSPLPSPSPDPPKRKKESETCPTPEPEVVCPDTMGVCAEKNEGRHGRSLDKPTCCYECSNRYWRKCDLAKCNEKQPGEMIDFLKTPR